MNMCMAHITEDVIGNFIPYFDNPKNPAILPWANSVYIFYFKTVLHL
jgi:hypothetical protein